METLRPRLAFIINSLAGGGAERALTNVLQHLTDNLAGFDVHLILLDHEPEKQVPPHFVIEHVLDSRFSMVASIRGLSSVISDIRPALMVSFLSRSNCASIIVGRLHGIPTVVSERVHTTRHFGSGRAAALNKLLTRLLYPRAAAVIAVSEGIKRDLMTNYGVDARRITVIGNPIDQAALVAQSAEPPEVELPHGAIMGAGRLVPNKNFALLIEAYGRSRSSRPLVILGEGPERGRLEALVRSLGLEGRVSLPGFVANPYPLIAGASFLVSSSNAEGFPNTIVETMMLGRPVIATDCETGPREVLDAGRAPRIGEALDAPFGVLTPTDDVAALAEAITRMDRPETLTAHAARATAGAQRFGVAEVVARYWTVIESVRKRA